MEITTSINSGGVRLSLSWQADAAVLQRRLEADNSAQSGRLFQATAPEMAREMTLLLAQAHEKCEQLLLVQSCKMLRDECIRDGKSKPDAPVISQPTA